MASGETNNQALYEQLAAACAEQERASVEHCAEQGNVPMCSEQFETAMKRIVLQLNERPQHRQPLGGTGTGLDDSRGHRCSAPLGDHNAVGAAQQGAAHDRAQIVGVLNAIAQHQKRCLPLCLGSGKQVLHGGIFDLAGKGGHTLMALGAGHEPQLVGVHPLYRSACLLGKGGIVRRHRRCHILGNKHRIHTRTALQQLGHRVFTVDKALVFRLFLCIAAGTAGLILLFHDSYSFRSIRGCALTAAPAPRGMAAVPILPPRPDDLYGNPK